MKKTKTILQNGIILLFIFITISITSCKKDLEQKEPHTNIVEDMKDMNVDENFSWQAGIIGEINISFINPHNISLEREVINIVDENNNSIMKKRIIEGNVTFNINLPRNGSYYIYYPVSGDRFLIEKTGDIVLELGNTMKFKSTKAVDEDIVSCTDCDEPMVNPGIELPVVSGSYTQTHQNNVPGWETSATDHLIEIWTSGFLGVPSQEGTNFLELNANQVSDLYQEVCLNPGSSITWSVWHRGRSGVDVAEVKIGGSIASAVTLETMSDGNTAWGNYQGTYTVPEGQNITYFVFSSVSAAGGASSGNFLDNFEILCDFDGDGIPDEEDDDPSNPNIAYQSFFPTSGKQVVAFEDLWPNLGDFDFNDLTLSNQVTINKDANFNILFADFKVSIDAIGAGIHNGIGMMLYNVDGSVISNDIVGVITGDESVIIDPNNTNGIILTNDVYSVLEKPYQNNGNGPTSIPDTISFSVNINGNIGDFIPELYIFRSDDRSHEIHRKGFPGTSMADQSLFGQQNDNGNYSTANGLPWGIEIILEGNYESPIENIQIIDAYPNFQSWANSGGSQNANWYTTPVESKVVDIFN